MMMTWMHDEVANSDLCHLMNLAEEKRKDVEKEQLLLEDEMETKRKRLVEDLKCDRILAQISWEIKRRDAKRDAYRSLKRKGTFDHMESVQFRSELISQDFHRRKAIETAARCSSGMDDEEQQQQQPPTKKQKAIEKTKRKETTEKELALMDVFVTKLLIELRDKLIADRNLDLLEKLDGGNLPPGESERLLQLCFNYHEAEGFSFGRTQIRKMLLPPHKREKSLANRKQKRQNKAAEHRGRVQAFVTLTENVPLCHSYFISGVL